MLDYEEIETLINARVAEALEADRRDRATADSDSDSDSENVFVADYCSLYNVTADTEHIEHRKNIKYLKKSFREFDKLDDYEKNEIAKILKTNRVMLRYAVMQSKKELE